MRRLNTVWSLPCLHLHEVLRLHSNIGWLINNKISQPEKKITLSKTILFWLQPHQNHFKPEHPPASDKARVTVPMSHPSTAVIVPSVAIIPQQDFHRRAKALFPFSLVSFFCCQKKKKTLTIDFDAVCLLAFTLEQPQTLSACDCVRDRETADIFTDFSGSLLPRCPLNQITMHKGVNSVSRMRSSVLIILTLKFLNGSHGYCASTILLGSLMAFLNQRRGWH